MAVKLSAMFSRFIMPICSSSFEAKSMNSYGGVFHISSPSVQKYSSPTQTCFVLSSTI